MYRVTLMRQSIDKHRQSIVQVSPESAPSDSNSNEENMLPTKRQLNYSESLNNLIKSTTLNETIDLCEVFVIIGAKDKSIKRAFMQSNKDGWVDCDESTLQNSPQKFDVTCQPEILDTYPIIVEGNSAAASKARNPQIMEQYLYLSNISLICFPDGYAIDTEFRQQKLNEICDVNLTHNYHNRPSLNAQLFKIMHFTITQSCGAKKYLTSLQYKVTIHYLNNYPSFVGACTNKVINSRKKALFYTQVPNYSIQTSYLLNLKMLELIYEDIIRKFHSQFNAEFSGTDDLQEIEKKLQRAKIQSKVDRLEFYLSTFFHHLQMDGSNLEIELYKKLELPQMTQHQNEQYVFQQKKPLIKFVNSFNKECLRLENYEFKLLFQKVRPKMLLQMFVSLLHERKIILIHNESSKNAILIEALISLLYPLQWNFTNISYMIPSMTEYLEAPFPYIVGLPRDLWKQIYEQKWDVLGDEVVAFDIDNQKIYSKEELPEFPQPYTQLLIKQLEIQLDKSKQVSCNFMSAEDASLEQEKFWNNFTLKVKQQFLNFLIFLINTFENFYVTASKQIDPTFTPVKLLLNQGTATSTIDSCGNGVGISPIEGKQKSNNFASSGSANDIFNFQDYVQNVRENQGFFEKFVTTQAFINFIEQAFYEEQGNLSDASIRFFKECTRKLAKENIQAVRAMQDEIINNLMHKFSNRSISYSIEKCYVMYQNTLRTQQQQQMILSQDNIESEDLSSRLQVNAKPLKSQVGLICTLDLSKIIKMKPLDRPLIQKQYAKFNEIQLKKLDSNSQVMSMKPFENTVNFQRQSLTMNDYFSAQLTPIGKMFETKKEEAENKYNDTAHIKIEIEGENNASFEQRSDDQGLNGNDVENQDNQLRDDDNGGEDAAGFMGFFKKTFSSVKKTFQSTFNNKDAREEQKQQQQLDNSHLEESPDLTRAKQRQANRGIRSQTFHMSSHQVQTRDRKNNESFFTNLLNMAVVKKPDNLASVDREVKSAMLRSTQVNPQSRRNLNGSGFFVFNEEDMKNMTEMSPKNMTGNFRSTNFKFDYQAFDAQLTQRQKPLVKGAPVLDNQNFSNRIRSISYQNSNSANFETIKKLKLGENQPQNANNNNSVVRVPEQGRTIDLPQNRLTFAEIDQTKTPVLSPSLFKKKSTLINTIDLPVSNTAHNSAANTQRKDESLNKQQFEELYKKSTENLFYAPLEKTLTSSSNNTKYNIWKAKTGKVDMKAAKPPKYNHNATLKRTQNNKQTLGSNLIQKTNNQHSSNNSSTKSKQIVVELIKAGPISENNTFSDSQEESKSAGVTINTNGILSDHNITDDDQKPSTLSVEQNILHYKKNVGLGQEQLQHSNNSTRQNLFNASKTSFSSANNSSLANQIRHQQQSKHRRQVSQNAYQQMKGENGLVIMGGMVQENIDPEDDSRQGSQTSNKQIESMQIGRARKRPSVNPTSGSSALQFTTINKSISKMNQRKQSTSSRPIQQKPLKTDQSKTSLKQGTTTAKAVFQVDLTKKDFRTINNNSSNVKDDEEQDHSRTAIQNKLQSRHLQTKTVQPIHHQSHQNRGLLDSEVILSKNISYQHNTIVTTSTGFDRLHDQNKYIIKKQQQLAQETMQIKSNLNIKQSSMVGGSSVNVSRSIVAYNLQKSLKSSSDLWDYKQQEDIQRHTVQTPNYQHQQQQHQTLAPPSITIGLRGHSLSQYSDQNRHPNKFSTMAQRGNYVNTQLGMNNKKESINANFNRTNNDSDDYYDEIGSNHNNNQGSSKLSQFRSQLKPLNKITQESFNQIAKLSGDVDHEPNTPKSGANITDEDELEDDYDSDDGANGYTGM